MHISQAIPHHFADSKGRTTSSLPACIERVACQLGARYNPDPVKARFNLHADEFSVKSYLGTYLPRTVFEFLTIGHDLFSQANMLKAVPIDRPLRILDLGSGIGGAWMGLASALFANGHSQPLHIDAVDGNRRALAKQAPFARAIAAEAGTRIKLFTTHCTLGADAASFAKDLVELLERLNTQYDFVLVSKHLSEFYCAAGPAATGVVYEALHLLAPALTPQGYLVVLDLSTRIDEVGEFFPNLMAREIGQYLADHPDGMRAVLPVPCAVSSANGCAAGGGQCFTQRQMNFSHSINRTGAVRQESTKVTYRVFTHQAHARHLTAGYSHDLAYHVNAQRDHEACHRGRIVSQMRGVNGFLPPVQTTQRQAQPRIQPSAAVRQQPVVPLQAPAA
jgi:SAM-dependent methyltransferase